MEHTPKHVALQLGALITLYVTISFLLALAFGIINLRFPDAAEGTWIIDSASSAIRLGIAVVVIFFPAYLALTRVVQVTRRTSSDKQYLAFTKWLIYLSLLIAGITLLGNAATIIMTWLEGELTSRFLLKALTLFVVVGLAFYYYIYDVRGYWLKNERLSQLCGAVAAALVLAAVVIGFMSVASPREVRERKLDDRQVQDLQQIQWKIQDYILLANKLPTTLEEVYKDEPIPQAPTGREGYTYALTASGFELCATYALASYQEQFGPTIVDDKSIIRNGENWNHAAGADCFGRVVVLPELPTPVQ
jgi:type II secretory pathway pseudopilin PulG